MLNFPRLSSIFGMPVSALDAAAIEAANARNEVEDFDLDWKQSGYPKDKNFELAKDVAAFANTSGGVIILGVKEDGGGAAIESTPIDFSTFPAERTTQVLASKLRPFLYGVEIRNIQTEAGKGYQLIAIPRSRDAPHAVVDQDKGAGLLYPVRDGRTTRHLTEYEVATRYRDRYAAREEIASRLEQAHVDGLSRIAIWVSPFLALSLIPTTPGHRGIGAAALAGEHGFLDRWESVGAGAPMAMFARGFRVIPGIRRAIVTEVLHRGRSRGPHAELHYDGTGFAATNAMTKMLETKGSGDPPDDIQQDGLETVLLELLLMLGHHAADTGASGEWRDSRATSSVATDRHRLHPERDAAR